MRIFYAGLAALVLAAAPLVATPSHAVSLKGVWQGGGYVTPSSGARERAKCRVIYRAKGKNRYTAVAQCATASLGGITQTAALRKIKKNTYAGSFYNAQYGVSGSIYVKVKGSRQSLSLRSPNGRARLSLRKR